MEKKISVITGASGHIGYALLMHLLEQGEQVRLLLRRDEPRFENLPC